MEDKEPYKQTNHNRLRLSDDEVDLIGKYRDQKTKLEEECEASGIDPKTIKHYWYKSKVFSIFAKPNQKSLEDLKKVLLKDMKESAPEYPTIIREKYDDGHCLVIDPCDVHIGKLANAYETGDDYSNNLAVKRVHEGVDSVLRMVQGFNLDKIVLIIGNDILHTDNTKGNTTRGTPQDTDGMWFENFLLAKKLYIEIIEKLVTFADVHIIHNASNHDYMVGWMLAQTIDASFCKNKNVTLDVDLRHRKAFIYHNNLIGSTHGDGAKEADLPLLMAQEFKHEWAATEHRYVYTHHVHHKVAKDRIGVTIESSRSASGTDSWHHQKGYQHNPKAIEAYLHHPQNGQIARFNHIFK